MPDISPYLQRVHDAADDDHRLPVPLQAYWEIFPFEPESLVARPLEPVTLPEPPRYGEDVADCARCADPERDAVWADERWVLTDPGETGLPFAAMLMPRTHLDLTDLDDAHAADLGRLSVRIARVAGDLPDVARVHVNKWGDGGAHLHLFFLGRPAGLLQTRGSNLALWDDMLPRVPDEERTAALRYVADRL